MTRQEETQREDHKMGDMQERNSEDFESLMLKRRAKERLEGSNWSEAKVEDVQVYSGYEFVDAQVARKKNTNATVKGTISGLENAEDVLDQIDDGKTESYKTKVPRFSHADGAVVRNGRKYLYRQRRWIVVTVGSPDGTYSEDYVVTRTPKFEDNSLGDVYKQVVNDVGELGSLGSPPDSKREYLRTDRILNSDSSNMIVESILRLGVMGSSILAGFFGAMAVMAATGSLLIGTLFLSTVVFTASFLQHKMYEGWFEVAPIDWMDEIPESAQITNQVSNQIDSDGFESSRETRIEFMNSDADVQVEKDGTLKIQTPMSEWVFESDDEGIPSDKAKQLYDSYGGINFSEVETIPVQIAKNDERVPLEKNHFESKDGEWVLRADGI